MLSFLTSNWVTSLMIAVVFVHNLVNFLLGAWAAIQDEMKVLQGASPAAAVSSLEALVGKLVAGFLGLFKKSS